MRELPDTVPELNGSLDDLPWNEIADERCTGVGFVLR
jgi:hypothetical protein